MTGTCQHTSQGFAQELGIAAAKQGTSAGKHLQGLETVL